MSNNNPDPGNPGINEYTTIIPYIIAIINAVLKPFFSFLSCSILFCSSSTIVVVLYCSVLASSSSLLYFPTFGAIIFSIIIVPTIEMIIVAAIIKKRF